MYPAATRRQPPAPTHLLTIGRTRRPYPKPTRSPNYDAGVVTTQVPSQRQLDAYQRWNLTRLGPAPPGQSAPPTPVSASPVAKPEVRATPAKAIGV